MGLGDFLNKIGVTQDDDTPQTVAAPEVKSEPAPINVAVQNAANYSQAQAILTGASLQVDPAPHGLDHNLLHEMIMNNFNGNPGFNDVNEFLKVHDSLAAILVDEATRFKAAIAASKLTAEQIVTSASSYLPALEQEKATFASEFIANSESDIKLAEDYVTSVTAKIQELSDQISALAVNKKDLENGLATKKAVLAYSKIDFETVTSKISNQYGELVAKINKYTAGV